MTRQLIALGKKNDVINRLILDRDTVKAELSALKTGHGETVVVSSVLELQPNRRADAA
jgi:hypothetical protein